MKLNDNRIILRERGIYSVSFSIFILFSLLQNIGNVTWYDVSFKPFYFMTILFAGLLFFKERAKFAPKVLLVFMLFALIVSVLNIFAHGINALLINYFIGFFVILTVFCTLGEGFSEEEWLRVYQRVGIIYLASVYLNIGMQLDKIVYFLNNVSWMVHPDIDTIAGGGVTLESTWLAIFTMPFYKSKWKWFVLFLSVVVSAILATRAGIMINGICFILFVMGTARKDKKRKILLSVIAGSAFLFVILNAGILDTVFGRFVAIGAESGSRARLNMWVYTSELVYNYPFGTGIGNAVEVLEDISSKNFFVDSIHCLPLQMFCELGIIGGIFFISIIAVFLIKEKQKIFKEPFLTMIFAYLVVSLFQFRGGEAPMYCILGTYLALSKHKKSFNDSIYINK